MDTTDLITTSGSVCVVLVGILAIAGFFVGLRVFGKYRERDIEAKKKTGRRGDDPVRGKAGAQP